MQRRQFVYGLGILGSASLSAASFIPKAASSQEKAAQFTLPALPYAFNALEPFIDKRTMELHHDKHHAGYVKNLNDALAKYPQFQGQFQGKSIEFLLQNLDSIPADIRTTVRNNGGGHANHSMFWQMMAPKAGGEPTGELAKDIIKTFGSFAAFQAAFNEAGAKRFGSGWAWLSREKSGKLKIASFPNQDGPIMVGEYPLLGNDVWEHAYYLTYQNKRADYLKAWWNVVNWPEVERRYQAKG
jgi:superoxide dismutase, Fe-Mn family